MRWHYLLLVITTPVIGMKPVPQKATYDEIKKLSHYITQDYTQLLDDLLSKYEFSRTKKTQALLEAIKTGKANGVAVLLGHNINVNGGNLRKQTPLLEAVLSRQVIVIKWLLMHGADPERRSLLTDFNDIPAILECEASDSDDPYISPLTLALARLQSRRGWPIDTTIYNILNKPAEFWKKESEEQIRISTTSCIEAIRHSDHQALIEYVRNCRYTGNLLQNYLNDRLKLAAQMGNLEAMGILIKAGAQQNLVFETAVKAFEHSTIESFLVKQYIDDLEVKKAIKRTRDSSFNPQLGISSINKFNKKKRKALDTLGNVRALPLSTFTRKRNITQFLQHRETTGTTCIN